MTNKNIRVTEEAHLMLTTFAEVMDISMSEAIEKAIGNYPQVVELAKKRQQELEDIRREIESKAD